MKQRLTSLLTLLGHVVDVAIPLLMAFALGASGIIAQQQGHYISSAIFLVGMALYCKRPMTTTGAVINITSDSLKKIAK